MIISGEEFDNVTVTDANGAVIAVLAMIPAFCITA